MEPSSVLILEDLEQMCVFLAHECTEYGVEMAYFASNRICYLIRQLSYLMEKTLAVKY